VTARIPIGLDDFRKLREQGLVYVDKSHLIREVLDKGAQTILLPRPRRFGKTLNLSMLRCFFEKRDDDLSGLFAGLSIAQAGEAYRAHFQRYPVIFITFKEVKARTWDLARASLREKIGALFDEHRYLLESDRLSERDIAHLRAVLDGTADEAAYQLSLLLLSRCLALHHGQDVVVLIDEYDTPIHAAWLNGYALDVLAFFRTFLNAGLKGNPHLFKAVVTGILRVAKESIFSDLNNLAVYTVLAESFSTCFGFTEPEVQALLADAGLSAHLSAVRAWYNGYVFGETVIYNPWSILSFLDRGDGRPRAYWVSTSSNDLVRDMLVRHGVALEPEIEALLEGGTIEVSVDEGVVLEDLPRRADALFGLLLFSGYLKAKEADAPAGEAPTYFLSIPNREVREVYTSTFREWLRERLGGASGDVDRLTRALLSGDAEALEASLQTFTENLLSHHDTAPRPELRPEQVYHAFVIGLLATLEPAYEVRSNRESGHGRADVLIRPRRGDGPGVVLELKVARAGKKTMARALAEGATQIERSGYRAALSAAGIGPVHALVVAFDGKRVAVRRVDEGARGDDRAPRARAVKTAKPQRKSPAKGAQPKKR
jgi:hypothetical protein